MRISNISYSFSHKTKGKANKLDHNLSSKILTDTYFKKEKLSFLSLEISYLIKNGKDIQSFQILFKGNLI